MRSCEHCDRQGQECSYEVWDKCDPCDNNGEVCWPLIDVESLMLATREWRDLSRDLDSLRARLMTTNSELQSLAQKFAQHKDSLNNTSSDADKNVLIQLREKGKTLKTSFDLGKESHEQLRKALQERGEREEELKDELAESILERFEQECDRCVKLNLQQTCTFPENSHCCTTCTAATVRCSGDVNWRHNDLLWHAADPLRQQLDAFLLKQLADASEFKNLTGEEQRLWTLEQPCFNRSGLTTEERNESSRLHIRRLEVRRLRQQIRADSFWDSPEYQRLWSLYQVLSICEVRAMRRWSDYDVELNELTGYPQGRNLPSADEMSEDQFRTAVAWVKAHPYYKYDDSLSTKPASREDSTTDQREDNTMEVDGAVQPNQVVEWPEMSIVLAEVVSRLEKVKLGLNQQLQTVEAIDSSEQREQPEIFATLLRHMSQNSVSLKDVETQIREIRVVFDGLEQRSSEVEE